MLGFSKVSVFLCHPVLPINIVVLDVYTHTTHCYFDNKTGMHLKIILLSMPKIFKQPVFFTQPKLANHLNGMNDERISKHNMEDKTKTFINRGKH